MNFRIIKAEDNKEWQKILSLTDIYDFYHTASYHRIDHSGDARLLVFQDKYKVSAIPFIFRKIEGTPYQDVTSVYGYAGWIRSRDTIFPETAGILGEYFEKEKVVSAFSRLHPVIQGSDIFPVGNVLDSNLTLGIDLSLDQDVQRQAYSRSVKGSINRSVRCGIKIRQTKKKEDIILFSQIYKNAMARLNAPSYLHFPLDYFEILMNSNEFESFILFAELSGNIIGGALFTICNGIMQYHLGVTVDNYMRYSPLKHIIDMAREIGNSKNLSVLHLGGGFGGINDNLYIFKSRMASKTYQFKVWKWIVNENIYKELSINKPLSSFFPLYRT